MDTAISKIEPNINKKLTVDIGEDKWARIPIKTHIIMPGENLEKVLDQYLEATNLIQDDLVILAESVVAITQGRCYKLYDIRPRRLAYFLSSKVSHNPGGVGLTNPEMMEMAFREAGTLRMLMAAFASAIGKLFGIKGWFYIVAGSKVRDIDGPDEYTLAPFNKYVVLAPANPDKVAKDISAHLGCQVAIVDINDLGQNILGNSGEMSNQRLASILADNPLGQSDEQTPIGIIRKVG